MFTEKGQPYQPKLVAVGTFHPNRTRPRCGDFRGSPFAMRRLLELRVMDSPVPLMHHDPDRSWITDPDPDHPKGMQPNTYESWKIRFANTPARVHVDLPRSQIQSWS